MRNAIGFLTEIYEKRYLLYQLTRRDFVSKYVESYLGLAWALIEPLATTIILSVIFTFGFKAGTVKDVPFFIYMFTGMVAFNFFSMATGEGTNVIRSYSFLVKKVDFKLAILPIMKMFSCSIIHLVMLILLITALLLHGFFPTLYWFQFIYYFIAMNLLTLGLCWLTSSISVFVPDIRNLVSISLQFLFYLSPIFWNSESIPKKWVPFLKLNPMNYIINGYRDSFIYGRPMWERLDEAACFWLTTFLFLGVGSLAFKRLRPHFADVI